LTLVWGFGTFRNTEYIKFLLSFARPCQVFLGIILARVFILVLYLAVLTAVIIGQLLLNGIGLNGTDILAILTFGLISLLVLIFFLIAGAMIGSIKDTSKAIITAFVCWLCLVFLFPIVINEVLSSQAISQTKSLYSHEMQKLKIILKQSVLVSKEVTKLKSIPEKIEAVKKWNEIAWNSTFKEIEKLETEMMSGIKDQAERLYLMNAFTPVSFYSSVNNEISSRGYNFLIDFYKYVQEKQKGFVRYYFDHIFDDYTKIEPFMTKDDYVFQAKPSLPKYFWLGLVLNLGYILLAGFLAYRFFLRSVFPKVKDKKTFADAVIDLPETQHLMCRYRLEEVPEQLFNILSGNNQGFTGKIVLNGDDIVSRGRQNFVYIPHPDKLPGEIRIKTLVNFISRSLELTEEDKKKMVSEMGDAIGKSLNDLSGTRKLDIMYNLARFKKAPIYLLDNFFVDLEPEDAKRFCADMRRRVRLIIEMDSQKKPVHLNYDHRIFIVKKDAMVIV